MRIISPKRTLNGTFSWFSLVAMLIALTSASATAQSVGATTLLAPSHGATGVATNVNFNWTSAANANRYFLIVSSDPALIGEIIGNNSGTCRDAQGNRRNCAISVVLNSPGHTAGTLNGSGWTDELQAGTTYYWAVQPYISGGADGPFSTINNFSTASEVGATTLQMPPNNSTDVPLNADFIWTIANNANRYWITVSTNQSTLAFIRDTNGTSCPSCRISGSLSENSLIAGSTSVSGTNQTLEPNTTYYWMVLPFIAGGADGPFSTINSFMTSTNNHTLTVDVTGQGVVTSSVGINCSPIANDCSEDISSGNNATLNAAPFAGWSFQGWGGACSGTSSSCVVSMTQPRHVTATFVQNQNYDLSVNVNGQGVVTSSVGINCSPIASDCSESVSAGTNVTLNAAPFAGWSFQGWGGACSGTSSSCVVSMTQARSVTATFNQGSAGNEFLVSTTITGIQQSPFVTGRNDGGFMVVWEDRSSLRGDNSGAGVLAQIFDASGTAESSDFLVNTTTTSDQEHVNAAELSDGNFVIAWEDESRTGGDQSGASIRAQMFSSSGSRLGSEILVNSTTSGNQKYPNVIPLSNGIFAIIWEDWSETPPDTSQTSIRGQLFSSSGNPSGAEFLVNTSTNSYQEYPTATALADGGFVVIWENSDAFGGIDTDGGVVGQLYDSNANKIGGEFLINTTTSDLQYEPHVAALPQGGFVVAWRDYSRSGGDTSSYAIRAQRFNENGQKVGNEFLVNSTTAGRQSDPGVAALSDRSFLITWEDYQNNSDGSGDAVFAQYYDRDGAPSGSEFRVNQLTEFNQRDPSVAQISTDSVVVVWDGSLDIKGRIFEFEINQPSYSYSVTLADSPGQSDDTEFRLVGRSGWLHPGATAFVSSNDDEEDVTVEVRSNGVNSTYLRRLTENNRSAVLRPTLASLSAAYWDNSRPVFIFIDGIDGAYTGCGIADPLDNLRYCERQSSYLSRDLTLNWYLGRSDSNGGPNRFAHYSNVLWSGQVFGSQGWVPYFGREDRRSAVQDAIRAIRQNVNDPQNGDRPIVLVTHSWGTVIAYQALNALEAELNDGDIALLVTMGSPLGIGGETGSHWGSAARGISSRTARCDIAHGDDLNAFKACAIFGNFVSFVVDRLPEWNIQIPTSVSRWINFYSQSCDPNITYACAVRAGDFVSSVINTTGIENHNVSELSGFSSVCSDINAAACHGFYYTSQEASTFVRNHIRTFLEGRSAGSVDSAEARNLGGLANETIPLIYPAATLRSISTNSIFPTLRWSSLCSANGRFRNSNGIMVEAGGYCPRYWVTVATDPSYLPTDPFARSCDDPTTHEANGVGCVISLSVDGATDAGGPGSDAIFQVGSFPDEVYGSQRAALQIGETYYWRVQAFEARGRGEEAEIVANGEFSEIGSFTIDGTSADGLIGASAEQQDRALTVLQQGSGRGSTTAGEFTCPVGQTECVFAIPSGHALVVSGEPVMSTVAGYGIDCNPSGDRRSLVGSCTFEMTSNSVVSVRFDLETLEIPELISPQSSSTTLEDTPLMLWDDVEAADYYLVCVSQSQNDVSSWAPSLDSSWDDGCSRNAVLIGQLYGGSHEIGDQNLIHQPEWGGASPLSNELPSYGTYYWRVVAVNAESGLTAASAVGQFEYIEPVYFDVSVNLNGTGNGEVTFFPIQTICSASETEGCSGSVLSGTAIAFAASPTGDNTFSGWNGCDSVEDGVCLVTVDGPETIAASFSAPVTTRTLTVDHQGAGTGSILINPPNRTCTSDCSEDYTSAVSVNLTATPNSGSRAGLWGGACSGTAADAVCSVTMSTSQSTSYRFDVIPEHSLTVATSGIGSGNITSSPSGISCGADGSDCTEDYEDGTSVTLTATANSGSEFASWTTGDCPSANSATCQIEMSEARSATARFTQDSPPAGRIVAATLPGARSSYVGGPVITAFLSVVSRASTPAQGCRVTAAGTAPFSLSYQELNGATPIGSVNPLFDLPNGGSISFIIAMTPTAQTGANGYVFLPQIECENASLTPIEGVSSLLVSIGSAPVPDILSIGATSSNDGVVRIPATGNRIAFMAASAVNIGAGDGSAGANQATVTATVDTGAAQLPVTLEVCESGPTGCVTPRGETSVDTVFDQNVAETYTVFVRANGAETVPFSPANSRVFLRFTDANGVVRSMTSAAISAPAPDGAPQPVASMTGRWSVLVRQSAGSEPILHRASLYLTGNGDGIIDDGVTQRRVVFEGSDLSHSERITMFAGYPVHLDVLGAISAGDALADQPYAFWGIRDVRDPQGVNWLDYEGPYGGVHITSAGEVRGTLDGCQVYGELSSTGWADINLGSCPAAGSYIGTMDIPANDNSAALLIANDQSGWRLEASQ